MKRHTGILIFSLFLFAANVFASHDTAYGKVGIVDKKNETDKPSGNTQPGSAGNGSKYADNDNDTGSCSSQLCGCLFQEAGSIALKGLYELYVHPVAEIAAGNRLLESPQDENRFCLDLGTGFLLYPGIAAGLQLEADVSGLYRFGSAGIRLSAGIRPSILGIYKDFQRPVYVKDSCIGTERYETGDYFNFQIPIEAFLHWFPSGERGAFHLYFGGGAAYAYERLEALRTTTFNAAHDTVPLRLSSFVPMGTIGIGRITDGRTSARQFRIEYSLTINPDKKTRMIPSDNTRCSHVISMHWGLVL